MSDENVFKEDFKETHEHKMGRLLNEWIADLKGIPSEKKSGHEETFSTPIDGLMEELEKKKTLSFGEISKQFKWGAENTEKIGLVLEKQGIVDVHYPTLITKQPWMAFKKKLSEKKEEQVQGTAIEEYSFLADFIPVQVKILRTQTEQRPIYFLKAPYVKSYTQAFLEELKEEIADKIPMEISEVIDTKKINELKLKFFEVTKEELKKYFPEPEKNQAGILAGLLLHSMYGLGKLETLMADHLLEEIAVNSSQTPIMVYHRKYGWLKTNMFAESEEEIYNYSSQIARKIGRQITTLNPILDAHLITGDRVNATLSPVTSFGNTLTIRKFSRRPWTIIDFIGKSHTMNIEMASLLWLAIQYEMNLIIAGGTASGKTSTLNVLSSFIPSYHRTISIEDVREIMLPDYMHANWVPMTTRNPNPEGKGEIKMLELMQSSLRMRPDRIILGEIRRHREAEVLFEAMHTGHSIYSTLHANSSAQVLRRLTEPPINIPPLEVEAIDFVLVQYRDRKLNKRRTLELAEIEAGVNTEQLRVNTVFKWSPRDDSWESINPATKFVRNLNLHTGMTEEEIKNELNERAKILQWMQKNNLSDINQVGQVLNQFYNNPDKLKKIVSKDLPPNQLLEV